jgi:hypothetical protein
VTFDIDKARHDIREAELFKDSSSSMAEHDPFGAVMQLLVVALEWGLDDGISGGMNETEFAILEKIATIVTQEAGMPVEPRIA